MTALVIADRQLSALGSSEWLLANGLGGFAMGTASGIPERRYHAYLIAATTPPVGRVVVLHSLAEYLVVPKKGGGEVRFALCSYRFVGGRAEGGGVISPDGVASLQRFKRDAELAVWEYHIAAIRVTVRKNLSLLALGNQCTISYTIDTCPPGSRLELRPFTPLRDFHHLGREGEQTPSHEIGTNRGGGAFVQISLGLYGAEIVLIGTQQPAEDNGVFVSDPQWWRRFSYVQDAARGQESVEDLFSPGYFTTPVGDANAAGVGVNAYTLRATLTSPSLRETTRSDIDHAFFKLPPHLSEGLSRPEEAAALQQLARAAGQFIVRRDISGKPGTSIIAGYPWFSDWGRDTCIALPGLLLTTGRFEEARRVLEAFANMMEDGLIPNCFDNGSGAAEYNTADASLWYLNAACELAAKLDAPLDPGATGTEGLGAIARACLDITSAYEHGTAFNIKMDPEDGLIAAGDAGTQLTWMDARRDGVVFTPRHGKPVELSALWYNGLRRVADALPPTQMKKQRELREIATWSGRSFVNTFWNEGANCLFDCIVPTVGANQSITWTPSADLRPNQIFAASLTCSPLDAARRAAVVATVRDHLLTPYGLRTLARSDPKYTPRYEGNLFERDRAYHNGTVWPWLIGAYAESVLRLGGFSAAAKSQARSAIQPLLDELTLGPRTAPGPIGQVAEVYDGDPPHRPNGCPAQAWSIAELLRVFVMTLAEGSRS